jgi:hypothetical protein
MTTTNIICIGKGIIHYAKDMGLVFGKIARSRAGRFEQVSSSIVLYFFFVLFDFKREYRLDRLDLLSAHTSFMYALQHYLFPQCPSQCELGHFKSFVPYITRYKWWSIIHHGVKVSI